MKRQRTIGVVTVARSDYGIYRPLLRRILSDRSMSLRLIAAGAHLAPLYGFTVREIEADGIPIAERIPTPLTSDSPAGIAAAMGETAKRLGETYQRIRPDILTVLGDRYEMHAAALAALPFGIPVAHIHGGEITEGAFDDSLRHSMTKLSHLHFASTAIYAARIIQLGEEPWRVTVSGALGLDNLGGMPLLSRKKLEAKYGIKLGVAPLLVTFHPETLEYENALRQTKELLAAISGIRAPIVFTLPNADTNHGIVTDQIRHFAAKRANTYLVPNLGTWDYFSFMAVASAMVGNSSSGIIEAPSFGLPVVNVGNRQKGRIRARNVIDTGHERADIRAGIRRATSPAFRAGLRGLVNPYGSGGAADRIAAVLKSTPLDRRLIVKKFCDIRGPSSGAPSPACVVLGAGGHARVLLDCLREAGQSDVRGLLDANRSLWGKNICGIPVLGGDRILRGMRRRGVSHFVVGAGTTRTADLRRRLFESGLSAKLKPLTIKHPSSVCSDKAVVGPGSQLLPRCVVNAGAVIGRNVIINTGAIVEHDCRISSHAHVATGAKLAGAVTVGEGAMIGAGATVRQGVKIGKGAIVAAGAVVVKNVPAKVVVAGIPARPMIRRHA